MEEDIILNDLPINEETVITDETNLLSDENSVLSDEDISSISENLLNALVEKSIENSEDSEETSEDTSSEQSSQIDYSQQISDIYSSIGDLQSSVDSLDESIALQSDTLETYPEQIRENFDDIIQFQYLTYSLIFGLLIAIIFFQGLKK